MTGIKEGLLRRSMHVALYLILAVLVMVGWTDTPLRARIVPYGKTVYDLEEKSGNARRVARWREKKAVDPEAVVVATKEYADESDRIGQFVDAWLEEGEAYEVRTSAACKLYGEWCDKYGYRKENSTNFNNAIQRFFRIERKRPKGETGSQTTMLIGCRFLEHENGEAEDETPVFS